MHFWRKSLSEHAKCDYVTITVFDTFEFESFSFLSNFNAEFFKVFISVSYWCAMKKCFAILFRKETQILKIRLFERDIEFLFLI